jgi:membrane-bound lytic murein transglycosylase D
MKISPVLLTHCCVALLCLSLSACSSHTNKFSLHRSGDEASAEYSSDEEISASEPEETAGEELEALKGLSAQQKMTLEQAGIDATKYDFPIVLNDQVQYYLDLFQGKQRNYYTHWLARSTAYRPYIEAKLKKAGLPRDLVFLAMIESGYNPSAYSPANACGLWQFIAGTARTYGLKIDSWVDERREPEKATQAAIKYLSKLHKQFDDWYLAVAAYNTGEGRIADTIETYNTRDFWEIADSESLYLETKRYVPKLIAAIIIGRDPEKYGFTGIDYHAPRQYEQIKVPGNISLEAVAAVANTTVKQLRTLNNELRKNQTPPDGRYTLRIPVGTKELIAANLHNLKPITHAVYATHTVRRGETHTVRRGETLSGICKRYDISMTNLLKANNLRSGRLISGQRLQFPTTATRYVVAQQDTPRDSKGVKTVQQTIRHQLKSKETLTSVARQYKVSVHDLMRWNKITNQNKVKRGQQLAIHVARQVPAVSASIVAKSRKTLSTPSRKTTPVLAVAKKQSAGSKTLAAVQKKSSKVTLKPILATTVVQKSSKQPTLYVVKNGDTLLAIARRFKTSPQDLRKWNKLSDNTLRTGNKLVVKKG